MTTTNDQDTYRQIFFPNSIKAKRESIESGGKFAYYTSATTAQLILKNQEIWMRNTSVMNDYMEVEHGLRCVIESYNSHIGKELRDLIDQCFPGVSSEFETAFNLWIPIIKKQTYILSLSEHLASEDKFGRLSMWRAYGGSVGVALIFNGGVIHRPTDALKAYASAVFYETSEGVTNALRSVMEGIREHTAYIRGRGKKQLIADLFEVFRFAAICTKHPAFCEEREWRVISTQKLHPSARLVPACEIIGGVPQMLLKLKFEDHMKEGLYGLSMPTLLDRILIGPCEHPETIKAALSCLLEEIGIPNPDDRIHITGVPLRPNQR